MPYTIKSQPLERRCHEAQHYITIRDGDCNPQCWGHKAGGTVLSWWLLALPGVAPGCESPAVAAQVNTNPTSQEGFAMFLHQFSALYAFLFIYF